MRTPTPILATLVLAVSHAACSRAEPAPGAHEAPPATNGALKISFDADEAFEDEDKQLISRIITESGQRVRALLPTLPDSIDVTVTQIDRNIDGVGGVTGRSTAPGMVLVQISRVFPGGISAAARNALASLVFHEFHHLDRGWTIQGNAFGPGISIAAVNEGLADVFSEEYTGVHFEAANSYPEDADKWLEEILALPTDANYSHWMVEHPDGRTAIGYRVGRYIIHQATATSGKGVLELSKLSPDEILALAAGGG